MVLNVQHWCVLFQLYARHARISFVQTNALALPKEHEMDPKDKYTVFSPHHRGYRKGIHKLPKWTRVGSLAPPYLFVALILPALCRSHKEQTRKVFNYNTSVR